MLTKAYLQQLSASARARQQRALLVLSGDPDWLSQQLTTLNPEDSCLWLGSELSSVNIPEGVECVSPKHASNCLGQERQRLIVDAYAGFNPNAFGQVSGVLVAGGLMLLLIPKLNEWPEFNDPELQHIAVEPYGSDDVGRRFIQRIAGLIATGDGLQLLQQGQPLPAIPSVENVILPEECEAPYRSLEQQQLVEHLAVQLTGKRPAVQVVTADRGRGKSASLGLLAAKMVGQGMNNIAVVAPAFSAVEALFSASADNLPEVTEASGIIRSGNAQITFYQPDRMLELMPQADVLLVDEAAAIPVPVLARLLKAYSRCVFASTVHGYEGTGQGFAVRFKGLLNRCAAGWHDLRLNTPVRWAEGDSLEAFTFAALMLAAEPAELKSDPELLTQQVDVRLLDRDALLADEALLNDVFGLLVLAHYRTTPGDLRILLDSPNLQVWGAFSVVGNVLLGTMLVAAEGPLEEALAQAVYAGKRRPKGHLIPQTLLAQEAIQLAGQAKGLRIMRIAVRPALQRRKVAERMLQQLELYAGEMSFDWLGTGFGLTSELLSFWRHNGYQLARIGLTRDSVSATHGVIMLRGCSTTGSELLQQARSRLQRQYGSLLSSYLNNLDVALVTGVFADLSDNRLDEDVHLSPADRDELTAFALAHRQYDSCQFVLQHWVYRCALAGKLTALTRDQQLLVIGKILQAKDWHDLPSESLQQVSPRNLLKQVREAIAVLLNY